MIQVLVTQRDAIFQPGFLSELFSKFHITYDVVVLDNKTPFPLVDKYAAVFNLAGAGCANDVTSSMKIELERIQEIVRRGIPYLGICLGHQTLVKAMGGNVFTNPVSEIGWKDPKGGYFEVTLTEQGAQDPLFKGTEKTFAMFQCHNDAVDLAPGMICLASSKYTAVQAVKLGQNAYGMQFHPELTESLFAQWIKHEPRLAKLEKDALQTAYLKIKKNYEQTRETILRNFLAIVGLIK